MERQNGRRRQHFDGRSSCRLMAACSECLGRRNAADSELIYIGAHMAFEDSYRLSAHAVILDVDHRVLQLKQTYGNLSWGLPGGAVDPGETVVQTIERECLEELGLSVRIGSLTGIYYHKAFNSHVMIFRCDLLDRAEIKLSTEHSEFRYFPLEELPNVQRRRVVDCLEYDGKLMAAVF